jgi:hypothetical protein
VSADACAARTSEARAGRLASDPCGKNHGANVPDHVVRRRITESSIVNKPIGHTAWSSPPIDGLRRMPMSYVAMEVVVAGDLEQYNLAVVRHVPVGLEAADGAFQIRNIRRPGVAEELASGRDRPGPSAAAVSR